MISVAPQVSRLNIHPGDWYFGNEYSSLYTVLGSCVTLSVWHPTLKLGGFCHYLLACQPKHLSGAESRQEAGRYASSVLPLLKQAMQGYDVLSKYQLGLFGGCDAFVNSVIGRQNILYAQRWLHDQQLTLTQCDVGGTSSRTLALDINSGALELKHYAIQMSNLSLPTTNP